MLVAQPLPADSTHMRRSCCYAPDILEMLQADLVIMLTHAFGPKNICIGYKILMKQPHDCSY